MPTAVVPKNRSMPTMPVPAKGDPLSMIAFDTTFGAVGVVESPGGLVAVRIGYCSFSDVCEHLDETFSGQWADHSNLADRIEAYLGGQCDSFEDVVLDSTLVTGGNWTPFRAAVTTACRKIRYGAVSSYAELAQAVGQPRAARAVGSVMARNCWPIVVGCHRILSSGGGLGGFSAPRGLPVKRELLNLERSHWKETA